MAEVLEPEAQAVSGSARLEQHATFAIGQLRTLLCVIDLRTRPHAVQASHSRTRAPRARVYPRESRTHASSSMYAASFFPRDGHHSLIASHDRTNHHHEM